MERSGLDDLPRELDHGPRARRWPTLTASRAIPKITIVNGGAKFVYFYIVLSTPARVQQPIAATITKLTSGRWRYRLDFKIPRNLQIVAGIPLRVESGIPRHVRSYAGLARHDVLPAGSQVE